MKKSKCVVLGIAGAVVITIGAWLQARVETDYNPFSSHGLHVFAQSSDVIAVGDVVRMVDDMLDVQIVNALVGCTNGQIITFPILWREDDELDKYPTNHARIVFCVSTNTYRFGPRLHPSFDFEYDVKNDQVSSVWPRFLLTPPRAWFYVDADDGELYNVFTNLVRTLRTEKNITNFVEVARSAIFSPSDRVREDVRFYFGKMLANGPDANLEWVLTDPLLDDRVKDYIRALQAVRAFWITNPDDEFPYHKLEHFLTD